MGQRELAKRVKRENSPLCQCIHVPSVFTPALETTTHDSSLVLSLLWTCFLPLYRERVDIFPAKISPLDSAF